MPEYFCGKFPSKTPQAYVEARNFMIRLYWENPLIYLTGTTCRWHISGDVCAVLWIHAFLETWGIINFNVDPFSKPHWLGLNKESINKLTINASNKYFMEKSERLLNEDDISEPSKPMLWKISFLA